MSGSGKSEQLRAYLLGALPETDRQALEEQIFCDEAAYEEMLDCENDLLDDYARGRLDPEARKSFEEVLAAGGGRPRVLFSRAMAVVPRRRRTTFSWRMAVAAGIAAIAAGCAFWFAIQNRELRSEMAHLRSQPAAPPVVASLTLAGPTTRGATIPLLRLPRGAEIARIELEAEPGRQAYQLELLGAGKRVWAASGLPATGSGTIVAIVPAALLRTGDYEMLVSAAGPSAPELIASFPFRIE